jgi:hypothetical protein
MRIAIAALTGICSLLPWTATSRTQHKKFIQLGWDIPNTAFLRDNWRQMESSTPFDGVIFKLEFQDDNNRRHRSEAAWDNTPWAKSQLQAALDDLKACHFARFTDNFLRFNATPGNLDWADDPGWTILADKAGICAWLTKAGGAKGLALDFESYGARQFRFDPARGLSFARTSDLARRRGRQFVQAIAAEFPDAVILALWLNSINVKAGQSRSPESILATEEYGLLPAFVNGMLDALPPGMVLVDGCEHGYYLDGATEYLNAASALRQWFGPASRLVAPENRAKYRTQVQAGFGFYLDMYINEPGNRYYFGPRPGGTRLDRLRDNMAAALAACDEYVWIYGEQCRWWPEDAGANKRRLWEEAMPGLTHTIQWVRDPLAAARTEMASLREKNLLVNLVRNPDFSVKAATGSLPDQFSVWQDEKNPTGSFAWDGDVGGGSAKAVKVNHGVFLQKHPAAQGQTFAVEAQCLRKGTSVCTLVVRWQRANSQWVREEQDKTFAFEPATDDWEQAFGVVVVPPDAEQLVILLAVRNQMTDADVCWFDNVGLYRLMAPTD